MRRLTRTSIERRIASRALMSIPLFVVAAATSLWSVGQAGPAFQGLLHEHPAIQYATRPTSDRVARLNRALTDGSAVLQRESHTGYLRAVLRALDVPVESQLLV